jgi:hypothetical protein
MTRGTANEFNHLSLQWGTYVQVAFVFLLHGLNELPQGRRVGAEAVEGLLELGRGQLRHVARGLLEELGVLEKLEELCKRGGGLNLKQNRRNFIVNFCCFKV